ncbi:MAG: hypothetical protein KDC38_16060 [Planctomycetes bacterium]|nr:hypothetical protein [Planctomycetota bacterium]
MMRFVILFLVLSCAGVVEAGDGVYQFIRGDVNVDGSVDIADPIALLDWMFIPGAGVPPPCADSADGNDDGAIDTADVIFMLYAWFVPGSPQIPAPIVCGGDPTPDGLGCDDFPICPPTGGAIDFSEFVIQLFSSPDATPTEVNGLSFVFDEDPTAFDGLLMP